MIRTRFAPSPTGFLHVGGLRTALYSYLVAKQAGGTFVLRIEDTDRERQVPEGTLNILKSLYWAGVVPDEGVKLKVAGDGKPPLAPSWKEGDYEVIQEGNKEPYIQSERLEIYQQYANQLIEQGHAYYCFCTPERLEELREYQQARKLPTMYDRHCLKIDPKEETEKVKRGEPHVIRLKMPREGETVFTDLIRGEVSFKNELIDDQVLIKSDGFPTYHLAVVVDDHLMEITHVIRGEEWVSSTPKHIQLYTYFGWEMPQFAHLPLILNPDKSKLSKRQGDVAVEDYCAKGYLPEALVNFIAFLGWNPGPPEPTEKGLGWRGLGYRGIFKADKEIYSLEELIRDFDIKKVNKGGAVFNLEKLDWYNKEYMKWLPLSELVERAKPWLDSVIPSEAPERSRGGEVEESRVTGQRDFSTPLRSARDDKTWLEKVIALERERVTTLSELPEAVRFVFELPEYPMELLVWRKGTLEETQKNLAELKDFLNSLDDSAWTKEELEKRVGEWIKEKGYSTGSVLWPLRAALSGQQNSPGPYEIADVLGKQEAIKRLEISIDKLL